MTGMLGHCPWCGSPGEIYGGAGVPHYGAQWQCSHCGARGPVATATTEDPQLPSEKAADAFWSVFPDQRQPSADR